MLPEVVLTLLSVFAVVRFWRTALILLVGGMTILMVLGAATVTGWLIH
jgi:hypothetical protein